MWYEVDAKIKSGKQQGDFMSSISSIRLSGLATGMDTDAMVKSMLTADQEKIE